MPYVSEMNVRQTGIARLTTSSAERWAVAMSIAGHWKHSAASVYLRPPVELEHYMDMRGFNDENYRT